MSTQNEIVPTSNERGLEELRRENEELRERLSLLEKQVYADGIHIDGKEAAADSDEADVRVDLEKRRKSQEQAWDLMQQAYSVGATQVVDAIITNPYLKMKSFIQQHREGAQGNERASSSNDQDTNRPEMNHTCRLTLNIDSVSGIPGNEKLLGELKIVRSAFFVKCEVGDQTGHVKHSHTSKVVSSANGTPVFKESFTTVLAWKDVVKFSLHVSYFRSSVLDRGISLELGRVEVPVPTLLLRECARFWFAHSETKIVLFDERLENPCQVAVSWEAPKVAPAYSFWGGTWVWGSLPVQRGKHANRPRSLNHVLDEVLDSKLGETDLEEAEGPEVEEPKRKSIRNRLSRRTKWKSRGTPESVQHSRKSLDLGQLTPRLSFRHRCLPKEWNEVLEELRQSESARNQRLRRFSKHCMVVTRGTRGDVQPFLALAIGLAERYGWLVTICTEPRYREMVERYQSSLNCPLGGGIQFRTSGGDTEKRIMTPIAKWGMKQKSSMMQLLMLARSEREFFDSEPMMFYWAKKLRPDLLVFGFTSANMAMVMSEALRIPMCGFILQPTVIPSEQYPAVLSVGAKNNALNKAQSAVKQMLSSGSAIASWTGAGEDDCEEHEMHPGANGYRVKGHKLHGRVKHFMEHNPVDYTHRLNVIRRYRGLEAHSYHKNNYEMIIEQNVPVVVPINEKCFGGKPKDWTANTRLTDFIFLRSGQVPQLEHRLVSFLMEARSRSCPVVVLAFSSMPVSRNRILSLACQVLDQCASRPRIIALTGNRFGEPVPKELHARVLELVAQGRLLELRGAPFGRLFPQVSAVIMHGGLGTTAEAFQAGVPCMVTGLMVMDQRFWGRRVAELGVGPEPEHIDDLDKCIVGHVDRLVDPTGSWSLKARELAADLQLEKASRRNVSEDGVAENAAAIVQFAEKCEPIRRHEGTTVSPSMLASAAFDAISRDVRERLGVE